MTQRKKLIEVALPLEAINAASAREKTVRRGQPANLHLWWARRPITASRAIIFTSLVEDPDAPNAPQEFVEACKHLRKGANAQVYDSPRQRLFDFIETLAQWESNSDEVILGTARELIGLSTGGNPPPLLDPFAGGGSIPLEGQRLGLEAYASDLNPIAVMINKAQIEIPPRFTDLPPVNPRDRSGTTKGMSWSGVQGLAADVVYYGDWIRERALERIEHLFPPGPNGETIIAWLWARTVKCPNPACAARMPLVRSFQLSKKKGRKAWIEPHVNPHTQQISFEVRTGNGKAPDGTVNRRGATCIACNSPVSFDYLRAEGKNGRMGTQLMAIVTEGERGRNYYSPSHEHKQIAEVILPSDAPDTNLPDQALGFRVQLYGMVKHRDLFTPRQLVALTTFSELVSEAREQIAVDAKAAGLHDDEIPLVEDGHGVRAYSEAISVYLSLTLDKLVDLNNALCQWEPTIQCPRNLFARQAIAMQWAFAESNVFSHSAGSWGVLLKSFSSNFPAYLPFRASTGSAFVMDATSAQSSVMPLICTDPPYYDNIGYADLSDFFYVWLRRCLRDVYPEIFSTLLVPKAQELIATPFRFDGDRTAANTHFERGIIEAFANMRRIVNPEYPLTVFYAFKQQENEPTNLGEKNDYNSGNVPVSSGWETMLSGLIESGFSIYGTWPIRSEMTHALKRTMNALASSIVLVCRPRPEDAPQASRREFVNALRRELPEALRDMQSGSIAPVDLAQASIGPGMAIYSRYRRVLEADGSPMTVRTALQLINQELDAYLAETEGDVDADTRFCINWFDQFGFNEGEFGVADVLARAKNTSVDGLVNAGVLQAGAGKVKLLHWQEVEPGWTPEEDTRVTVWEAVTHLIERINTHGESGSAALLLRMDSDLAAEAKNLAYRLYQICERKGWADHALDYNALVVSWPGLQERANELKQNRPSEQLGLL